MKFLERLARGVRSKSSSNGHQPEISLEKVAEQITQLGLEKYVSAEEVIINGSAFSLIFISLAWEEGHDWEHTPTFPDLGLAKNDYYAAVSQEVESLVGGNPYYLVVESKKFIKATPAKLSSYLQAAVEYLDQQDIDEETRLKGYAHLAKIYKKYKITTPHLLSNFIQYLGQTHPNKSRRSGHIITLDKQSQEETMVKSEDNQAEDFNASTFYFT